jgi:hypothetical protein
MKKFFSYAGYVSLLMVALNFTSCQDEFEVIGGDAQEQPITANSSTAKLIENTSTKDGSFDNIVDGASCFDIRFPYTVEVNGLEITIDSREDFHLIEEIFDEVDDDTDFLEILFPITITAGDFTEITIDSFEVLRELAAECKEGGDDDDIECIDFVYPMTVFTFDASLEQTGSIVVESDRDLRLFFKGLDDTDFLSFNFPISLKLYDGTTVVVNSNQELARTIEGAREACDEDDDDDYNDDDFDEEDFNEELVECIWFVKEFKRNNINQTGQYVDYIFNFKEDGTVVTGFRGATTIEGTWSTTFNDDGAKLNMEFDILVDFNLEWNVYDVGDDRIKLYNGEGNRIIMKQICEDNLPEFNPDTIREILRECNWVIKRVKNNGEHINRLLGSEFEFKADGVITLTHEETVSEGVWAITTNTEGRFVVAITMGDEPGVNFEWLLSDLRDRFIKFNVEGTAYELVIVRNCTNDDDDNDVVFIRSLFNDVEWDIAYFAENGDETTEAYADVKLYIDNDGSLEVRNLEGEVFSTGRWFAYRNTSSGKLELILSFAPGSNYLPLANDYQIVEIMENRMELKHENEDGGYDNLILERE